MNDGLEIGLIGHPLYEIMMDFLHKINTFVKYSWL